MPWVLGNGVAPKASFPLPPTVKLETPLAAFSSSFENWTLEPVGTLERVVGDVESTIPPLWIPTDPPRVLVANTDSGLVAFDANEFLAPPAWSFHPGASIFGAPTVDAARGRIYFGASNKRLYALDARGLFLWAFHARDNIATHPLVVNDLVIFGSEDGNLYAVEADTGRERWRVKTGGPVVAAPTLANLETPLVLAGSDDGAVYALDADTGARVWLFAGDDAIEAPLVVEDETAYIASRDGNVYALNARTGKKMWTGVIGALVRTQPIVAADRVLVVDEDGALSALDKSSGVPLWRVQDNAYVGAPLASGESIFVARREGILDRLDMAGARQASWSLAETGGAVENSKFTFGPSGGGGALWLTDVGGTLWRLGR